MEEYNNSPTPVSNSKVFDELLTELRHRRRVTTWKYVLLGLLAFSFFGLNAYRVWEATHPAPSPDKIAALIRLDGVIGPNSEINAKWVNPLLDKTMASSNVKGVILQVNSPGGTPVQSALIYERIQALRLKYPEKPIVTVGDDMLTSGAYFIASASDKIVVNRSTITGSIGVISSGFGFVDLLDKLGVERRVMTAGSSKNFADPFLPRTEEGQALQNELIGGIHAHFIDAVKEGRGGLLKGEDSALFNGNVWTGSQAMSLGLVDAIGGVQFAADTYIGVSNVKEVTPPKGLFSYLRSELSSQVGLWTQEVSPPLQLLP